jgi:hypothetical protein
MIPVKRATRFLLKGDLLEKIIREHIVYHKKVESIELFSYQ